ncbi:hypothetical protein Tco_0951021 [Tanacetum coccineum]|uniref:GRF-type domain-containing protein n=1 Tax=Tanacetum coccineum TaxID=301880 RepID=A0ABQ5DSX5_9ASTR
MVKMVPFEAFACSCGEGDVVLRQSYKPESYGKLYYACPKSKPPKNFGCRFFLWKETRLRQLMSSPGAPSAGPSTPPSYSSGPSTPPSYSSGPLISIEYTYPFVRINQKSQENSQKQAITDTRIRRVQKEAKESKPKPEKSSLIKKVRQGIITVHSSSQSCPHLKTRGNCKLRVKDVYSSGLYQDIMDKSVKSSSYWPRRIREDHVQEEKAQEKLQFYTNFTLRRNTTCHITDCHAGNPCVHICDPTTLNHLAMIGNLEGHD